MLGGWGHSFDTICVHRQADDEYDLVVERDLSVLVGAGFLDGLVSGEVVIEGAQVTSQMAGKRSTLASLTVLILYLSEPL